MNFLLVFLGGGLGAAARHGVNILSLRLWGAGFPFGTLLINVVGSLVMGVLVEHFVLRSGVSMSARLFVTTGVLGGFTTFSAFSLEAVALSAGTSRGCRPVCCGAHRNGHQCPDRRHGFGPRAFFLAPTQSRFSRSGDRPGLSLRMAGQG